MYLCKTPSSKDEFSAYYHFRWQMLRAPWQQPEGSECDELEQQSIHRMIVNEQNQVIAVGRLHKTDQYTGQIRYMAVADNQQGKGLGRMIIDSLEHEARCQGVTKITLNAREQARSFYLALGYQELSKSHLLYGEIQHYLMEKHLAAPIANQEAITSALQEVWYRTIPLSKAMNIELSYFDGQSLYSCCDLMVNKNLHNTMFAGSIYTLATLTGWAWVQFQLDGLKASGDIVLADANIRYRAPIAGAGVAKVVAEDVSGDFSRLEQGRKAKIKVSVSVLSGDISAAVFEGHYVIIPKQAKG